MTEGSAFTSETPTQRAKAPTAALASPSLEDLFTRARHALLHTGALHETPRGATRSLNGVVLTWQRPEADTTPLRQWSPDEIQWYLDVFVAKRAENDPARVAQPSALVFPYTYAARARFWDGGWGYLQALVTAMRAADLSPDDLANSRQRLLKALATLGERMHLQTILSFCALYPPAALRRWFEAPELVNDLARQWRRDLLQGALDDIAATPTSRRAVVSSLCYPQLEDQLTPRMGMPPYQLFQYLPGEVDSPISSIHVHRSLDLDGGAPLDFFHDLAWLREASAHTGRPVGDITVVAHNLHMYLRKTSGGETPGAPEGVEAWLCRVTDGYRVGAGTPTRLLRQPAYQANVDHIWARNQGD